MKSIWNNKLHVIAEIGMTHDGSFGLCRQLTLAAISAGANMIKYQWHIADEETRQDAPSPPYFKYESRFHYFKRTEFSIEQFSDLAVLCRENNVKACVSVFSNEALCGAISAGFDVIKVASGEVTNKPLLQAINKSGMPVVLSSGMASWDELGSAIDWLKDSDLCVLQCTSMYPTLSNKVGLNLIAELADRFNFPVGLSDHTLGIGTSIAAVTLGASVIEKHFTLSKELYGPDARFSLDKKEFSNLCTECFFVFDAIRQPVKEKSIADFSEMKMVFEKSIVARRAIQKGETLSMEMLGFKKPGKGTPARRYEEFLGRKVITDIAKDDYIQTWQVDI